MFHAVIRFAVPLVSLLGLGPVAGYLTARLRGPDGGTDASLLVSASPGEGAVAGLEVLGLATLAGIVASRLIGKRMGLFCAGLVLLWAAWGTGRVDLVVERTPAAWGLPLKSLALEGVLVGVLGVISAMIILAVPTMESALPEFRDPQHQHHHLPHEPTALWDSTAPMALGAAILAAAVVVYVIAQETLKGQTLAASILAGVFAAGAGRIASQRVSAVLFLAGIAALAAASPWLASILAARGPVQAALDGGLMPLARPMPLDYLAGAMVGMPMGLAWAESMITQHQPAKA